MPTVLDIPVTLQSLLVMDNFDALIALGVVIRTRTDQRKLVSDIAARGIARISLDFNTPIAQAILMLDGSQHEISKVNIEGLEVAIRAVEMGNHIKYFSQ